MANNFRKIAIVVILVCIGFLAYVFNAKEIQLSGGLDTLNQLSQWRATSTPEVGITPNVHAKTVYAPYSDAHFKDIYATDGTFTGGVSAGTLIVSTAVTGDLAMEGNDITNAGSITGTHFVATSTTATSTFAGGVNFDSGKFVFDPVSNRLSLGDTENSITIAGVNVGSIFTVHTEGATDLGGLSANRHSNTAGFGAHFVLSRSRGNEASETAVQSGDYLGRIDYLGHDGTDYAIGAQIDAIVDSTVGSNDMPTALTFSTTADGAGSPTERMRITNAGNVGIGTTGPVENLHVHSDTTSTRLNITNSTTGATVSDGFSLQMEGNEVYIWNYESSNMRFGTSNDTQMIIDSSGNIGIGITTPDSPLEISATPSGTNPLLKLTRASSGQEWGLSPDNNEFNIFDYTNDAVNPRLNIDSSGIVQVYSSLLLDNGTYGIGNAGGGIFGFDRGSSHPSGYKFSTASVSTGAMYILDGGNVGIGTASPAKLLHVSAGDSGLVTHNTATDLLVEDDNDAVLELSSASGFASRIRFSDNVSSTVGELSYDHATDAMQLRANDSIRMTIDSSGNVGIGTTTPSGKLNIYTGSAGGAGTADSTADELVISGAGQSGITILTPSGSAGNIYFGDESDNNAGRISYAHSSDAMEFRTADTLRAALTSAGLGIGNTPSYPIDILSSSDIGGRFVSSDAFASIVVQDTSDVAYFLTSDTKAQIGLTFGLSSNNLTIDTSGNVGIGTTTPSGKLSVTGSGTGTGRAFVVADSANDEKFAILDNGTVVGGIGGLTGGYTLSPTGGSNFYGLAVSRSSSGLTSPDIWDAGGTGVVIGHNSSSADLVINSSGNVGIGTTTPVYKLSVENSGEGNTLQLYDTDGNCLLDPDSGSLVTTCSSDARLKTNIRDTGSAIDYLNKLRIKDYTVIASGVEATGVIAQEVQKTHPELVQELGDGFLGVTEISSWKLVKAIQELYSTIVKIVAVLKTHESRLDRLEAENEALKVRLEAIEAKL